MLPAASSSPALLLVRAPQFTLGELPHCTVTHQMWMDLTLPSAPEREQYLTPAHCDLQRWQVTKWETKKWDSMNLLETLKKRLAILSLAELEHR